MSDRNVDTELSPAPADAMVDSPSPAPSDNSSSNANMASTSATNATKKRSSSSATAPGDDDDDAPRKVTKRRAARACVSCRARKVRCDVVEGAPCGNCRWDNVECVVQESRRRKKHLYGPSSTAAVAPAETQQLRSKPPAHTSMATSDESPVPAVNNGSNGIDLEAFDPSTAPSSLGGTMHDATATRARHGSLAADRHVPHLIYQRSGHASSHQSTPLRTKTTPPLDDGLSLGAKAAPVPAASNASQTSPWAAGPQFNHAALFGDVHTAEFLSTLEDATTPDQLFSPLPSFVRPLPRKIEAEDVRYLQAKGALALPSIALQNALLQAYVEYVHPYMPLMDLHDFVAIVNCRDGLNGQVSLFLYQAVMFSATAFVDMEHLAQEGFSSRKAARKAFFSKTRLLYDFDYESDRLILVQALLLMTYWYETPDDQKDTWHWMGVAISLAHTIGLHRNPDSTSMAPAKKKLWRRIWWCCFMRDRLVALGMRRPTRINNGDFDVPMLVEDDFDLQVLPENNTVVPPQCTLMRDLAMQRELATMCIAKARLCLCISQMLKAQYSVLIRDHMKPENTTNSTMMLFPNKKLDNFEGVTQVDLGLMAWAESLPACCRYRTLTSADLENGRATLAVQRTLLQMVYYTTISALHRPQFLPSSPSHTPTASRQVQEMSRLKVRDAALHITHMASELHQHRLERYLPTTGVTVILPAMIIHLLEMKNPVPDARERAMGGFRQCLYVMEKLREIYAAADYATGFLDAALRKAAINIDSYGPPPSATRAVKPTALTFSAQTPPPDNAPYMTPAETMFNHKVPAPVMASMMPPNTINAAALELPVGQSPPPTDFDSTFGELTPSASGDAAQNGDVDMADLDFMQSHDEFDWNAVTGTDFDVDQWLQFPGEGNGAGEKPGVQHVENQEDASMAELGSWVASATAQQTVAA